MREKMTVLATTVVQIDIVPFAHGALLLVLCSGDHDLLWEGQVQNESIHF
jgi:hypothetical protein